MCVCVGGRGFVGIFIPPLKPGGKKKKKKKLPFIDLFLSKTDIFRDGLKKKKKKKVLFFALPNLLVTCLDIPLLLGKIF